MALNETEPSHARPARLMTGLLAQGVASASNLLVGIFVARTLGPASLGQFSLLFATLTLMTALQTSWVGDSLTVMGAHLASAVLWWQHVLTAAAVILGVIIALAAANSSWSQVVVFAVLVALWLYEEYGRRSLMAELRFAAQGLNDLVYFVVTLALLLALVPLRAVTLTNVLVAMAAGAGVAATLSQPLLQRNVRWWRWVAVAAWTA